MAGAASWEPPPRFDEFRLVRRIGQGAMGQVFLAHDTHLDRPVAVKFLAAVDQSAAARERFLIEARAIARLNHPNVVTLYRTGEVARRPYLVSEFIDGQSLDRLERPLPWRKVLDLGLALCRGLGEAHRHGILHRDIKPANAILSANGVVRLLDFGLAKLVAPRGPLYLLDQAPSGTGDTLSLDGTEPPPPASPPVEAGTGLTGHGALLGTPRYMAPEVLRRQPATAASDVYSLGALLYELCSGSAPHGEVGLEALIALTQGAQVTPLSQLAPDADRGLCRIIDRCLRREPAERFSSALELLPALEALARRPRRLLVRGRWPVPGLGRRSLGLLLAGALVLGAAAIWWRAAPPMVYHAGGPLGMGSTRSEIEGALEFCKRLPGEVCKAEDLEPEGPRREVTLSPFRIDATEVSNERFAAWLNRLSGARVGDDEWVRQDGVKLLNLHFMVGFGMQYADGRFESRSGLERMPATQMTWDGALRFCQARGLTLPTEAQWEFAARGSERRTFPWGEGWPLCEGVVSGRWEGMRCAALGQQPAPVGLATQDRTPLGVRDLAGNVSEWVMDRYVSLYPACPAPCRDPVVTGVAAPDTPRVVRGSSWSEAASVRGAARMVRPQAKALTNIGFRCAAPAGRWDLRALLSR